MMIKRAPATDAVAIEKPKAIRLTRLGLTAISCNASLSCDTARMARPIKVCPKKTSSTTSISSETRHGISIRSGRSTKPKREPLDRFFAALLEGVIVNLINSHTEQKERRRHYDTDQDRVDAEIRVDDV